MTHYAYAHNERRWGGGLTTNAPVGICLCFSLCFLSVSVYGFSTSLTLLCVSLNPNPIPILRLLPLDSVFIDLSLFSLIPDPFSLFSRPCPLSLSLSSIYLSLSPSLPTHVVALGELNEFLALETSGVLKVVGDAARHARTTGPLLGVLRLDNLLPVLHVLLQLLLRHGYGTRGCQCAVCGLDGGRSAASRLQNTRCHHCFWSGSPRTKRREKRDRKREREKKNGC